ncbi:undecaprenyl-diphosphate phosphatase [Duganella sp. FT80W]|uniref:Undecaprenyl-diphosphatase n=1 Tax=Duganella guangzhouensis TaxID=2666084 RepID=A0A6I2L0V4_9BURK|nr:undecaprenyl-diphosphate phosphatase [Duganella guangzhouensis]MRW89909.1 undecaprenyl-diphosphate phosphatase [Duganella guangzhouensis]
MSILQVALLAAIQGFAELLPVSSSAHVITAEKLMGLDPTAPEMTLLLVMLHTGTMFAVIVYFWKAWRQAYFSSAAVLRQTITYLVVATAATGVVGLGLQALIKYQFAADASKFEIEQLFGNATLMAVALAAAGVLIIVSSRLKEREGALSLQSAAVIGGVQGLCLPFRGFSRSGATISTGLVAGVARKRAEEFSFALVVVLTPAVIVKEVLRVLHARAELPVGQAQHMTHLLGPSLAGMVLSFGAGLLALRWLSSWLEAGRWHLFGAYCLLASVLVYWQGA